MKTAFIYRRISQDEKDKGEGQQSLANQLKDLTSYSVKHSINILKDYNEGTHTADEYRITFQKMINEAKLIKPSYILVREQSRFSRDVALTMQSIKDLENVGVTVNSLLEGNLTIDKTMTGFKAVIDAYHLELGRKHQRLMMDRKSKEGLVFGRPPIGYKAVNKTWIVDRPKADLVKAVFQLYVNEDKVPEEIVKLLNLSKSTVYNVLKNNIYTGYFKSSKKYYGKDQTTGKKKIIRNDTIMYKLNNNIEPLINEELFTKAYKKRIGNTRWKIK